MPSTIWIGSIRFGDFNIPVKLHTAVSQHRIQFHLIKHEDDEAAREPQLAMSFADLMIKRHRENRVTRLGYKGLPVSS